MVCSFTALDEYFGVIPSPLRFERFEGDLVGLASSVDGLTFPGLPYADAVSESGGARVLYRCFDGGEKAAYPQTRLARLPGKNAFDARGGVYERLFDASPAPEAAAPDLVLFEAAALASRYSYEPSAERLPSSFSEPSARYQRDLLELIVTGKRPEKGFELLLRAGFVDEYWPELSELASVSHSKDYHPEGDAWRHTMETFGHRKAPDLLLSLGLLLHDTGKPDAVSSGGRRFDGHSELGERAARAFLGRLGYPKATIDSVAFLVRYHMLPAALPRVPPSSVGRILDDPLFPVLLELYRCDELSTFRGPDGYYEACAAYKAYLRNSRNPYRDSDGKRRSDALHRPSPRTI
ncbi:MAG: HD domain-containing protein [Spirochaetes bacterium]|nr:HD domain-containing protein [Spirochaetota bacterium]MBU1082340.1 HD domain-containing protein [Spirochaetota bacterium]